MFKIEPIEFSAWIIRQQCLTPSQRHRESLRQFPGWNICDVEIWKKVQNEREKKQKQNKSRAQIVNEDNRSAWQLLITRSHFMKRKTQLWTIIHL